jgi:Tfp pilus assembly protein PilO
MSRNFELLNFKGASGPALWLKAALAVLVVLNLAAIYLYFAPPGGSRRQLTEQDASIRRESAARFQAASHLKVVSQKVELGGEQTSRFAKQYFIPNRMAFSVLVGEMLRMSSAAGLHEGQRAYSQEPIEGTDDLNLLTINANYSGSYDQLMNFLNQVDRSDQLLILDTLSATPMQQGSGILNVTMRFLAIVKEDGTRLGDQGSAGGQP